MNHYEQNAESNSERPMELFLSGLSADDRLVLDANIFNLTAPVESLQTIIRNQEVAREIVERLTQYIDLRKKYNNTELVRGDSAKEVRNKAREISNFIEQKADEALGAE